MNDPKKQHMGIEWGRVAKMVQDCINYDVDFVDARVDGCHAIVEQLVHDTSYGRNIFQAVVRWEPNEDVIIPPDFVPELVPVEPELRTLDVPIEDALKAAEVEIVRITAEAVEQSREAAEEARGEAGSADPAADFF